VNLQRLRAIIRKEVTQLLRDRRTFVFILIQPLMQLVLYGFLSSDILHQPAIVWDQSHSAESRRLIQAFVNTRYVTVHAYAARMQDIQGALDGGTAKIGIVIPPDYAKLIHASRPASVMVVVDASDANSARTLIATAQGVGSTLSQRIEIQTIERHGLGPTSAPIDVRARAWYNPDLRSQVFIVPGVLAIVLQFSTTFLSMSTIVRERELGTLEQLVVTPIQPSELMLGKILPLVGIGYFNMTLILLLAWAAFGVPVQGSLLLLYALTLAFFFSSLGMGTLISTMASSFQQAIQITQILLLPSIMLSGFIFPRESLPIVLQWIGNLLPLTYFMIVVRGILLKGVGLEYLWPQVLPLVVIGAIVFIAAILRFQKKIA